MHEGVAAARRGVAFDVCLCDSDFSWSQGAQSSEPQSMIPDCHNNLADGFHSVLDTVRRFKLLTVQWVSLGMTACGTFPARTFVFSGVRWRRDSGVPARSACACHRHLRTVGRACLMNRAGKGFVRVSWCGGLVVPIACSTLHSACQHERSPFSGRIHILRSSSGCNIMHSASHVEAATAVCSLHALIRRIDHSTCRTPVRTQPRKSA